MSGYRVVALVREYIEVDMLLITLEQLSRYDHQIPLVNVMDFTK